MDIDGNQSACEVRTFCNSRLVLSVRPLVRGPASGWFVDLRMILRTSPNDTQATLDPPEQVDAAL